MSNRDELGTIPDEIAAKLGASLTGWNHLTRTVSRTLPTNLHRSNLVRRGALDLLKTPPRQKA